MTDVRAVQFRKKLLGIIAIWLGNVIDLSEVQLLKLKLLKSLTPLGITIEVSALHPLKLPVSVKLSGNVNVVSPEQL